jgi:hypothetical protein
MAEPKKSHNPQIEIKAKIKDGEDWKEWAKEMKSTNKQSVHGTAGALYFVGFIGSLIYWWQAAVNFGAFVTGFLKACVWPAYVAYNLLVQFYGKVQ